MNGICYRVIFALGLTLLVASNVGCGTEEAKKEIPKASLSAEVTATADAPRGAATLAVELQADEANTESPAVTEEDLYPEVLIATSLGDIRVRLNAKDAPDTVDNFLLDYVDREFYDQTIIHYVDSGFMMAAGGYDADFKEKASRTPIRHEGQGGVKNLRGTISMVRHAEYIHSATSQFFINLADNPSLDYQETADEADETEETEETRDPASYGYCVFGEVIDGLDVVDKIGATAVTDKTDFPRTPTTPVVIRTIRRVR